MNRTAPPRPVEEAEEARLLCREAFGYGVVADQRLVLCEKKPSRKRMLSGSFCARQVALATLSTWARMRLGTRCRRDAVGMSQAERETDVAAAEQVAVAHDRAATLPRRTRGALACRR